MSFHDIGDTRDTTPIRDVAFPHEVLDDPSLNMAQRRALLCEWASDRCAVKSHPTLRWLPGTSFPVTFASVMDALARLDRIEERSSAPPPPARETRGFIPFPAHRRN